jgi:hypothetical protein
MLKFQSLVITSFILLSIPVFSQQEPGEIIEPEKFSYDSVVDWKLWEIHFTQKDISVLPNGNHNFYLLEYWYPGVVLSNPDNGGFSILEPVTISIHGESVEWNRYRLNSLDITNPADPGRPLIYIPIDLWNKFSVLSPLHSYTNDFGFNWNIAPPKNHGGVGAVGGTAFVGGDTWVTPESMDREPAQLWGAYEARRSMEQNGDYVLGTRYMAIPELPGYIFYEGIHQKRSFPLLDGTDTGNRNTVYLAQNINPEMTFSAIFQHIDRDHFGIETGNPDEYSLHGKSNAVLLTINPENPENKKFSYAFNTGFLASKFEQNNNQPLTVDLVDEVLYGKIPEPKDTKTWFVGNNLNFNDIGSIWIFDFSVFSRIRVEGMHEQNLYPGDMIARTYNGLPYDVTFYSSNSEYSQYLTRLNPEALFEKKWDNIQLDIRAGLFLENGFSGSEYLLTRFDPTGSIKLASKPGSKWEVFTGIQHDAIPVSSSELTFLNSQSPSGGRYVWNDANGDGIPQASETGNIYNTTGGSYHTLSEDLKFPTRDEVYFGILHNFSEKWHAMLSIHGKLYSNMYIVDFDPAMGDSGYEEINRPDINGGILYNRDVSAMGDEIYMLSNTGKDGYFASAEIQILKKNRPRDPWFMQFSAGAYYAQAYTIPGIGPDYNDMGQFAESSADPNKRLNTLAITDSERGYVVSILLGFNLGPFSIANTLRYRDGQPFGYMTIAEGLTQGPTIIQGGERSNPPNGMPRFTFAMTWDIRLRYIIQNSDTKIAISLDIFNVLDSRTEIYEYTLLDEQYRDSVESVTGRTARIMMHMYW